MPTITDVFKKRSENHCRIYIKLKFKCINQFAGEQIHN